MIEKGCDNCYYAYFDEKAYPCSLCIRGVERTDMWQPSKKTKADRKTESSSEKPNTCEKDCFLCKWLGDVDVCGRCRNRNLFAEADTEPTISKMEQVDEPQTCDNCKLKGSTKWCNNQEVCRAYKPKDEPQTEREGE